MIKEKQEMTWSEIHCKEGGESKAEMIWVHYKRDMVKDIVE